VKRTNPVVLRIFVVLLVSIICVSLFWRRQVSKAPNSALTNTISISNPQSNVAVTEIHSSSMLSGGKRSQLLLGETILRGYADTNLSPQNDLTLMSHLMDNSRLLLKSAAERPLSGNEDWADFFRGKNSAHERLLPDQHIALNTNGQLIDRWGTPLFFHAVGGGRFELRSAGPDRKLWTDDDIHRNSDGTFRHGANLNPPGLY